MEGTRDETHGRVQLYIDPTCVSRAWPDFIDRDQRITAKPNHQPSKNIALQTEAHVPLWRGQHNGWRLWTAWSQRRTLFTTVDHTSSEVKVLLSLRQLYSDDKSNKREAVLTTSPMAAVFGRHGMPLPASNPDRLTLKLECESHLKWGTILPNVGMLDLPVLRLFTMKATDGQTDIRMDKSNAYCPLHHGRGHNNVATESATPTS